MAKAVTSTRCCALSKLCGVIGIVFVGWGLACATPSATAPEAPRAQAEPIEFAFGTTQGALFDSSSTRGRSTLILFVTTFDLASQAQARYLNEVVREHRPRANAGAVVLEPPKHRILAEAFRTSLGLVYPVALANPSTLAGTGPFGDIGGVPALVVLDKRGRPVFRSRGAVSKDQMQDALRAADEGRVLPNR